MDNNMPSNLTSHGNFCRSFFMDWLRSFRIKNSFYFFFSLGSIVKFLLTVIIVIFVCAYKLLVENKTAREREGGREKERMKKRTDRSMHWNGKTQRNKNTQFTMNGEISIRYNLYIA